MGNYYVISGTLLRHAREQKGFSITSLALRLKVDKSFISAVEKGKRPVPKKWLPSLSTILMVEESSLKENVVYKIPPWLEKRVPHGFWKLTSSRRWFFEWFAKQLNLTSVSELLGLGSGEVKSNIAQYGGGGMFQAFYKYSLLTALSDLFPELQSKITDLKRSKHPLYAYNNRPWVRDFLQRLLTRLGFSSIEDIYRITSADICAYKGYSLIEKRKSPYEIAKFAFPDYNWLPWKFSQVSIGYWDNLDNVRQYLAWLSDQLGYKQIEDFYKISRKSFRNNYGSGLLSLSNGSPSSIIMEAFPEYDWKPWLFNKSSQRYWKEELNRLKYLKWFEEKLNIISPEDWYRVTKTDFENNYGSGLISLYYQGSPARAAKELYPFFEWKEYKFGLSKKRQQLLYGILKNIFQNHTVIWEYRFSALRFSSSNVTLSVDIFIPDYKLAIEYQGEQHFIAVNAWGGIKALELVKERDKEKREILRANNVFLLEFDYKWDGRRESVEAALLNWADKAQLRINSTPNSEKLPLNQKVLSLAEIREITANWENRFHQLQEFKEKNGNCRDSEIRREFPVLAKWLQSQINAKIRGALSLTNTHRLESLGVEWKEKGTIGWVGQLHQLKAYKEK